MDKNENYQLRKLLWLNHGCPIRSLYGDDGEMQCNGCLTDFKRDSAEDIQRHLTNAMHPDGEGLAAEIHEQVHNGASISDVMNILAHRR